jgi:hypothetical protein
MRKNTGGIHRILVLEKILEVNNNNKKEVN